MSQQINLYSPLFRKQKKLFTATAMVQAMAGVLAILALVYGYAYYQIRTLEREAGDFSRRLAFGMEELKKAGGAPAGPGEEKALDARLAELEAKVKANEQLLAQTAQSAERNAYIEPLRALARRRLEGVWLTTIQLEGESGELSLTGRAQHASLVPRYVERLGADPAMRGRHFSTLHIDASPQAPATAKTAPVAPAGIEFRLLATEPGGG